MIEKTHLRHVCKRPIWSRSNLSADIMVASEIRKSSSLLNPQNKIQEIHEHIWGRAEKNKKCNLNNCKKCLFIFFPIIIHFWTFKWNKIVKNKHIMLVEILIRFFHIFPFFLNFSMLVSWLFLKFYKLEHLIGCFTQLVNSVFFSTM